MAGLVPAIHVFRYCALLKDVDARDKRGHDAVGRKALGTEPPGRP